MPKIIKSFIIIFSTIITGIIIPGHSIGKDGDAKTSKVEVPVTPRNKTYYKNYIWIEGENALATNFAKEKTYNFYCSNKYSLQLSKDADPSPDKGYYATYVFHVPKTKSYDFWMACTPPGSMYPDKPGYASPIEWKIDEGQFTLASSENTFVKEYYAPGGYYWVKISTGTLSAGQHHLTFRVKQKRSSGWDYFYYIDAILFLPTYSEYLIPLMSFPEISPRDYSDKGAGVRLNTIDYYKDQIKTRNNYRENVFTLLQIYAWLYEYNKSIDLAEAYIKDNPKDLEIRLLLASNLAWGDRLDDSIKEYKNILAIDNKNITARKLLAVLAGWNNRYDEAIRNYKEIIEIDPMNVDAYISLATQLTWSGEVNKAIGVFAQAEAIAPDNIEVLYALGDNYNWSGNTHNAIRQFKKIISINEKEITAYKKLAKIYMDQGQNKTSSEILDDAARIIKIYPELSNISLDVKGEQDKELKATIDEYVKAVAKDPEDLEARKNLIDAYRWNRMEAKAITEYSTLLNVRILKKIDNVEERLNSIEAEFIKFNLMQPGINSLLASLTEIDREYRDTGEMISKNRPLPDRLSQDKVSSDYKKLLELIKKLDIFEKNLSILGDVLNYYTKDVQSFMSQKKVLKWEFDRSRILQQARNSEKSYPGDYRPKKVISLIDILYGNGSEAVTSLRFVSKKEPKKAIPSLIIALSATGNQNEARDLINTAIRGNTGNTGVINKLKEIEQSLNAFSKGYSQEVAPADRLKMAREIAAKSADSAKRMNGLFQELTEKNKSMKVTIRSLYEKGFLELENENVPTYREIGQYYLNNNQILYALDYYHNILQVQPLNVDINFKLGTLNETSGFWKSALANYEVCINNQLENNLARSRHFDIQKEYSPALRNENDYYSEKAVKRLSTGLMWDYPLYDWLTLSGGYKYLKIDEKGGVSQTGQTYPGIKTGDVIRHTGYAKAGFIIPPLRTSISLEGYGHYYNGIVDFEHYDTYDSKLNYYTVNYSGIVRVGPVFKILSLTLGYYHEDLADLSQSLRLVKRDEITSNTISGTLDGSFQELDFPLSSRIFIYTNVKYRMISDTNKRTSNYNELTFRLLRFPEWEMYFDLSGIYTYEASRFNRYTVSDPSVMTSLPYWAPDNLRSYGGAARWSHTVSNVASGRLFYTLSFNYTLDNMQNRNMGPGAGIKFDNDHLGLHLSYNYSHSKINPTVANPDPDPFISHNVNFGAKWKFFTMYTPKGRGDEPFVHVSASPTLITADGDGKDDFTTFTLNAFDDRGISSWRLDIFNEQGVKVNNFGRAGIPPSTQKWDGSDKANNLLPKGTYFYQLTIVNSGGKQTSSKKDRLFLSRIGRAVTLEKSYPDFSPNNDGIKDTINIEFNITDKTNIDNWEFSIMNQAGYALKSIKGYEFLPFDMKWDGRGSDGNVLPDGTYNLMLKVQYRDRNIITSPLTEVKIITRFSLNIKTEVREFLPKQGMLTIVPEISNREVEVWNLSLFSIDGRLIKVIHGSEKLPEAIAWDGTDEEGLPAGYNMPVTTELEVTDKAGNKSKSNRLTFWLDFLMKKIDGKDAFIIFDQDIIHERRMSEVSKAADPVIERLLQQIGKRANVKNIRVISHTTQEGSESSNLELSKERAKILAKIIKDKFKAIEVTFKGVGKEFPYMKQKNNKWDGRYEIEMY